jgi:hypothetical protein
LTTSIAGYTGAKQEADENAHSVTSCALGFLSIAPAIFHLLAIDARHGFFQTAVAVAFGRPDRPFGAG